MDRLELIARYSEYLIKAHIFVETIKYDILIFSDDSLNQRIEEMRLGSKQWDELTLHMKKFKQVCEKTQKSVTDLHKGEQSIGDKLV